jgi:tetratricopeptide (TPR) repeat protein
MNKLKHALLIFFSIISINLTFAKQRTATPGNKQLQNLLDKAKFETSRGSYDMALKLLIDYRKASSKSKKQPLMSFYVIESIGRIYLRIKQDPDAAIKFFSEAVNDPNLTDSEFDIIRAWLGRAKEWKELSMFPKNINDPKKLFGLGKKYYDHGINSQKYTMDVSASADFSLASNYLIPFTIHFDSDPNIGEALYMMGDIRRRSWHNNDYWIENFYLMEVIRRFPSTELATKAYLALFEDVHFGYTGSSGDHTPESWVELLKEFEQLSKIKSPSIPTTIKLN